MQIGFIGLGQMGAAMAANLVAAGHAVTVYNRSPAKAAPLVEKGARLATSVAEACRGDVVVTMLADDRAVGEVALADGGIVASLAAGALHVSMSTISVELSERMTTAHETKGQRYIAAPVFGRPDAAAAAKLFVVTAGAPESVATAQPLFDAMGQRTFSSPRGRRAANLVKLSGNFLLASAIEALGEAVALVAKGGVDRQLYVELLTSTLFAAPAYRTYGGADRRAAVRARRLRGTLGPQGSPAGPGRSGRAWRCRCRWRASCATGCWLWWRKAVPRRTGPRSHAWRPATPGWRATALRRLDRDDACGRSCGHEPRDPHHEPGRAGAGHRLGRSRGLESRARRRDAVPGRRSGRIFDRAGRRHARGRDLRRALRPGFRLSGSLHRGARPSRPGPRPAAVAGGARPSSMAAPSVSTAWSHSRPTTVARASPTHGPTSATVERSRVAPTLGSSTRVPCPSPPSSAWIARCSRLLDPPSSRPGSPCPRAAAWHWSRTVRSPGSARSVAAGRATRSVRSTLPDAPPPSGCCAASPARRPARSCSSTCPARTRPGMAMAHDLGLDRAIRDRPHVSGAAPLPLDRVFGITTFELG